MDCKSGALDLPYVRYDGLKLHRQRVTLRHGEEKYSRSFNTRDSDLPSELWPRAFITRDQANQCFFFFLHYYPGTIVLACVCGCVRSEKQAL